MTLELKVLYDQPKKEIASLLRRLVTSCSSVRIVVGFVTVEGVDPLIEAIRDTPDKLEALVVGAATYRAFDAFDELLSQGLKSGVLRVHLGHSRPTSTGAKFPFLRYHPMLHSKIYIFTFADGTTTALVGSHNMTGFALTGLNGEASIMIRGESADQVFSDLTTHTTVAINESIPYDPDNRQGYAWWAGQFMEGLADKFDDIPRDGNTQKTIIILAQLETSTPRRGDIIYFELPSALGKVRSLNADVHLYIFESLPSTPMLALSQLEHVRSSVWCKAIGIEDDRGGRELDAQWFLDNRMRPTLKTAPRPFRPRPSENMQQVRVKAYQEVRGRFDYLFHGERKQYEPKFATEQSIQVAPDVRSRWQQLDLIPPEHLEWFRVTDVVPKMAKEITASSEALLQLTPDAGSFILMSTRRRDL